MRPDHADFPGSVPIPTIPALKLRDVRVTANIDYLKFEFLVHGSALGLPAARCFSHRCESPDADFVVTIHDPSRAEIQQLVGEGDDPFLAGVEISIDFQPMEHVPMEDRPAFLDELFAALAPRFRPEDHSPTGIGFKAAFTGRQPRPFHGRLPTGAEELVFGHRSTGVNFKLYKKMKDNGAHLPISQWRVRMEITVNTYGLHLLGLKKCSSLLAYRYRRSFARCFQVVDRISVRGRARWSAAFKRRLDVRLQRRWARAGVHAIGHGAFPEDALAQTIKAAADRQVMGDLLDPKHYVLHPHRQASQAIGEALRQLERRMAVRIGAGLVDEDGPRHGPLR